MTAADRSEEKASGGAGGSIRKLPAGPKPRDFRSESAGTRTQDHSIKSRMLYQLSYTLRGPAGRATDAGRDRETEILATGVAMFRVHSSGADRIRTCGTV